MIFSQAALFIYILDKKFEKKIKKSKIIIFKACLLAMKIYLFFKFVRGGYLFRKT